MEDISENGGDNYNISTRISEKDANTERQNVDGEKMRCLQTQYKSSKSNRLNEACTGGVKGGVEWWKAGVCKRKGLEGEMSKGFSICVAISKSGTPHLEVKEQGSENKKFWIRVFMNMTQKRTLSG
jgi:hypothetical protein